MDHLDECSENGLGGFRARSPRAQSNGWDFVAARESKRLRLLPFRRKRGMCHWPTLSSPLLAKPRLLLLIQNNTQYTATWHITDTLGIHAAEDNLLGAACPFGKCQPILSSPTPLASQKWITRKQKSLCIAAG